MSTRALARRTALVGAAASAALVAASVAVASPASAATAAPYLTVRTSVNSVYGASASAATTTTVGLEVTNTGLVPASTRDSSQLAAFTVVIPATVPAASVVLGRVTTVGWTPSLAWTESKVSCGTTANCSVKIRVSTARPTKDYLPKGKALVATVSLTAPSSAGKLKLPFEGMSPTNFKVTGASAYVDDGKPYVTVTGSVVTPPAFTVTGPASATAGTATNVTVTSTPAFAGSTVDVTLGSADCNATIGGVKGPWGAGSSCTTRTGVSVTPSAGAFSIPVTFTKAMASQSVAISASGATTGQKTGIVVAKGAPVVTVVSIVDASAPPLPAPVSGQPFVVTFTVKDSSGNPYAGDTGTLSAAGLIGSLGGLSAPTGTTDATGTGTITATYSPAENAVPFTVTESVASATGSGTSDVVAAAAETTTTPGTPTQLQTTTGSGSGATADLGNGANGTVSLVVAPSDCGTVGTAPCDSTTQTVTLDFDSKDANQQQLYGFGPDIDGKSPVKVTLDCSPQGCPDPVYGPGKVAGGAAHTCFVDTGYNAECFGANEAGQTGQADAPADTTFSATVPIVPMDGVVAVSAGRLGATTCATTYVGGVVCWGASDFGQAGYAVSPGPSPAIVTVDGDGNGGPLTGVRQVAVGDHHTCALRTDGTVWCWGSNTSGQLGQPNVAVPGYPTVQQSSALSSSLAPVQVLTGVSSDGTRTALDGVTQIAAGGDQTCAIASGGRVWCWGDNNVGQLGTTTNLGNHTGVWSAFALTDSASAPIVGAVGIAAAADHTCAFNPALPTPSGTQQMLWCWGRSDVGQLGDGNAFNGSNAVPWRTVVDPAWGTIGTIAAGDGFTCIAPRAPATGTSCFGENYWGGAAAPVAAPGVAVDGVTTTVVSLAAGDQHACAYGIDRGVECWGGNSHGQATPVVRTWYGTTTQGASTIEVPITPSGAGDQSTVAVAIGSQVVGGDVASGAVVTAVSGTTVTVDTASLASSSALLTFTTGARVPNAVAVIGVNYSNIGQDQIDWYYANPTYVALRVAGSNPVQYQEFGLAPSCDDLFLSESTPRTGQIWTLAGQGRGYCVDVYAMTRNVDTTALSIPVLFVEDPKLTPLR